MWQETPEHMEADTRRATRFGNAPFLTALMEGNIHWTNTWNNEGANAPQVEAGDFKEPFPARSISWVREYLHAVFFGARR